MMDAIEKKISQLAVHFACSIPLKPELEASERDALKIALKAADSDHFQLFGNTAAPNAPVLFSTQRQYQIDSGIVTAPSLIFQPGAISILHAVKIGTKYFTRGNDLKGSEHNRKAIDVLSKIQEISKVKFTRAGKIFEFLISPVLPDEKNRLLRNLFAQSSDDICEVQLVLTRLRQGQESMLNVNTLFHFNQMNPGDPIQLMVKVDINNRKLEQSLEQRQIKQIWNDADNLIESYVEELLNMGA